MRFLTAFLTGLALLGAAHLAPAQAPVVEPERLPELGRSAASSDDSTALVLNPANLAFLPASELRWTGTFLRDASAVPWRGHAFSFALPLPFSLATGVRLDVVDAPGGANLGVGLRRGASYQWLTWGLAARTSRSTSLGASLQRAYGQDGYASGLASYSLAASFRFLDEVGLGLVAQHLNGPESAAGTLGPTYTAALAIRPLGTRQAEIGVEGKFLGGADIWAPRVTVGLDLPDIGRLTGELQVSDPGSGSDRAWLAALGVSVYLNQMDGSLEFGAAGLGGSGLGPDSGLEFQAGLAARGFPEPVGIGPGSYAVRLRLEEIPDARAHVRVLRGLWSLAEEPSVDAVVLELRAAPGATLAHVQELRDALLTLRRRGKRVLCHLEGADASELYLCAAADQTWINPAAAVSYAGLAARYVFFARLLEKVGVRADVIRVGEHKSAPERFTAAASSEVSRADKIDLLQQSERQLTEGIALGRNLSFAQVRAAAKTGPFMAPEAKTARLVDGLAFEDEIEQVLAKLVGRRTALVNDNRRATAPMRFAAQPSIALVYVEGDMVDGRSRSVPFLGGDTAGSYTIADALSSARKSPLIKAVVLRVESPGGSSTAADVIWREVELTAKVKPVIVSMGGYAASGGYYIAAPGTRIFANPATLTGSIGVFYVKADLSQLLDKVGVDIEVYKTTERADAEAFYRPFSEDERTSLQRSLGQFYDVFLQRVAAGRKLDKAEVDRVAQGRVWTGEQAKEHGLVDELGGLRQALAHARTLAGLPEHAPIIELPRRETSLLGRLVGVPGIGSTEPPELRRLLPPGLSDASAALVPLLLYSSRVPLMHLGYVPVEP